jgi:hypothetical protein
MQEETTSRVMAADRPYGEHYDFYSVSPEYFGYHLICKSVHIDEQYHHWVLICLTKSICEILGSRHRILEAFVLPGNCAVNVGSCFQMFRSSLSVPCWKVKLYNDILRGMLDPLMWER